MNNNNHDILKYCPRCAAPARLDGGARKIVCPGCGFKLYLNTAAAVAGLIFDGDGRLMLIRRNHEPQKGLLDLPGGFADFGEDAEGALGREIREELGVDVEDVRYFRSVPNTYIYGGVLYHTLDLFFTCRVNKSLSPDEFGINDEIAEILYKYPKDVSADELAFDSMKNLIGRLADGHGGIR